MRGKKAQLEPGDFWPYNLEPFTKREWAGIFLMILSTAAACYIILKFIHGQCPECAVANLWRSLW